MLKISFFRWKELLFPFCCGCILVFFSTDIYMLSSSVLFFKVNSETVGEYWIPLHITAKISTISVCKHRMFSLPEREEQQTPRTSSDGQVRDFLLETEESRRKHKSLKVPVIIVLELLNKCPLIIIYGSKQVMKTCLWNIFLVTNPTLFIVLSTDHLWRIKDVKWSGIHHRKQVREDRSGFYTVNQKRNIVGVFPLTKSGWDHDDEKGVSPGMHAYAWELFLWFLPLFLSSSSCLALWCQYLFYIYLYS